MRGTSVPDQQTRVLLERLEVLLVLLAGGVVRLLLVRLGEVLLERGAQLTEAGNVRRRLMLSNPPGDLIRRRRLQAVQHLQQQLLGLLLPLAAPGCPAGSSAAAAGRQRFQQAPVLSADGIRSFLQDQALRLVLIQRWRCSCSRSSCSSLRPLPLSPGQAPAHP